MVRRSVPWLLSLLLVAASFAAAAASGPFNLRQLEELERSLDLTPDQKDQYDAAVGATKRMAFQIAMAGLRMKERLREELAKPVPNLGILRELREAIVDEGRPLRREARAEWSKFFAMLDRDQLATLRRFLGERIDELGLLHEFMMQLIAGGDASERI